MKKFLSAIPILTMMFVPYALALSNDNSNVWLAPIMVGIVSLLSMIYPWLLTRFGYNARQILFWNMLLKIAHIPFFVFICLVCVMLFPLTIPLIIPAMIIDYIVLLGSAMYGVNGLRLCRKFENFSATAIVVNIVMQFFFCANVISAIYCYVKVRKASKSSVLSE